VSARRLFCVALAAAACGCGDAEPLSPLAAPKQEQPPGPADAGTPPPTDAGPVERRVILRNPLGGPPGNLLADGDFELSVQGEGQTSQVGWRGFTNSGEKNIRLETGGLCRTGLRCAVLEPNSYMYGRGAAASGGKGHLASVWMKPPPEQPCDVASVTLVSCDTIQTFKVLLHPELPDETGWCEFSAALPEKDTGVCILVMAHLGATETALFDSAAVVPDDGTAVQKSAPFWAPTAEMVDALGMAQKRIRDTMPVGRAPARAAD
jgi:hypothetical protein